MDADPALKVFARQVEEMNANKSTWMKRLYLPMLFVSGLCFAVGASPMPAGVPQAAAASKAVGTVKSISGNNIVLSAEGGGDTNVVVQDGARLLQIEPGETDLKKENPLQLSDVQVGDGI